VVAFTVARLLTLNHRLNVLGLASSFLLLYTAFSERPWWVVYGGMGDERTFSGGLAVQRSGGSAGKAVTVPMLSYLNLAARLSILLAAATTLLGSLLIKKPWSKPLMSLRGLVLPILFLAGLSISLNLAGTLAGVSIPLVGQSVIEFAVSYGGFRISTETPVTAALTQEYWVALTAGVLSALAIAIHGRMASRSKTSIPGVFVVKLPGRGSRGRSSRWR
jgi:hypothetical protein